MRLNGFAKFAWATLGWNILVIGWGAYVRATGSGAGCGNHWPTCNGQVIPLAPTIKTLIEFSHRAMSGVAIVLIIGLLVWAFRAYPRRHRVRLGAGLSTLFIFTEALIGAGLVLFQLVENDALIYRAASISAHLLNTFVLLACLTLTAWWASGGGPLALNSSAVRPLLLGAIAMLVLSMSGAITALGDTLFPAESLAQAFAQDFSATAHLFIQLRAIHPLLAVGVGLYLVIVASWYGWGSPNRALKRLTVSLISLIGLQWIAGIVNVLLLAPVWLQLLHLLLADSVWVTFIMFAASILTPQAESPGVVGRELITHVSQHPRLD